MGIKKILMRRDGLSAEEAQEMLDEARKETAAYFADRSGRDPEEILLEDFGLEPDYVMELL